MENAIVLSELVQRNEQWLDVFLPQILENTNPNLAFKNLLMSDYYCQRGDMYRYGILKNDTLIGEISLLTGRHVHDVVYWLDKDHAGYGYMNEALEVLERVCFSVDPRHPLVLRIDSENEASLRLAATRNYLPLRKDCYIKKFSMFMLEKNGHRSCREGTGSEIQSFVKRQSEPVRIVCSNAYEMPANLGVMNFRDI
ncbi:MAG: GNAT family N-acetyltransferase [Alphaproteobacteria bacterium]|nr:GNAT family N-acetyltransferase [Alphaproteobacteria bacterium]